MEHILLNAKIYELDTWFLPIIYLYRQSTELLLKSIIFKYITSINERIEFIGNTRHDFEACIYEIKKYKNNYIDTNPKIITWLDKYLCYISKIDKESDMFRFPFSKKMKDFFPAERHINLVAIYYNMNIAFSILKDILNENAEDCMKHEMKYEPQLILDGGSYYGQSVVGWKFENSKFHKYVRGYIESGKYLTKFILKHKNKHVFFLPLCYIYRNSIELSLKRILIEDCEFDDTKICKILSKKGHSILKIWNKVKDNISNNSNAPKGDNTMKIVESYINQLQNIDPNCDKFRYPIDKNSKFYYKESEKYDIKNISQCFQELFSFLDSVDGMISQVIEWKAEMKSYK